MQQFIANKFLLNLTGFLNDLGGGGFRVVLENRSVRLVFPPASGCANVTIAAAQVVGTAPNQQMQMTFTNVSSLASVQSLVMDNCTVAGTAYDAANNIIGSAGGVGPLSTTVRTLLAAGTVKVVLLATKVATGQSATVNVISLDTCGRGVSFNPIITTLEVLSRDKVVQRFEGLLSAEHYLNAQNGSPGLTRLEVNINGRGFAVNLTDGQRVSSDLRSAMREGRDNVVVLTGYGTLGSSAFVTLTDTPTGEQQPLDEIVRLTLGHSAAGLTLTWPETLAGWQLQSSDDVASGWQAVAALPVAADGRLSVTVETDGAAQFFRLHAAGQASRPVPSVAPGESAAGSATPVLNSTHPTPPPTKRTYDGILW